MNAERRPRGGEDGAGNGWAADHHDTRGRHGTVVNGSGVVITPRDLANDDQLWAAHMSGYAEGLRVGEWDGYSRGWQEGKAAAEAAEAAEWAKLREDIVRRSRDLGVRQRRGGDPHAVARERDRRGWSE